MIHGEKEEGSAIAPVDARYADGSSEDCAEIVETERVARFSCGIVKPIVGVRLIVAEILEKRAGVAIRPRPADEIDLAAGQVSKLGSIGGCLNFEFLQRGGREEVAEGSEERRWRQGVGWRVRR